MIANDIWPVGESAANWRARMIGLMVSQSISFDKDRADEIDQIWKRLTGEYVPDLENRNKPKKRPGVGKKIVNALFGVK